MNALFDSLDEAELLWGQHLRALDTVLLADPSACPGWTVRDLVNHVNGGGHRYTMLIRGEEGVEATREADYVGADPAQLFWAHERDLRQLAGPDRLDRLVAHRAGQRSVRTLLLMRTLELSVHSKDLADSTGVSWGITSELASFLLAECPPVITELRATGLGLYGPAGVPASTLPQDVLLALTGRR